MPLPPYLCWWCLQVLVVQSYLSNHMVLHPSAGGLFVNIYFVKSVLCIFEFSTIGNRTFWCGFYWISAAAVGICSKVAEPNTQLGGRPNQIQILTNFPKYENAHSRKKKLCRKTNLAQDVFDKILCGGESYKKLVLQRREREFSSKIRQISQLPGWE